MCFIFWKLWSVWIIRNKWSVCQRKGRAWLLSLWQGRSFDSGQLSPPTVIIIFGRKHLNKNLPMEGWLLSLWQGRSFDSGQLSHSSVYKEKKTSQPKNRIKHPQDKWLFYLIFILLISIHSWLVLTVEA